MNSGLKGTASQKMIVTAAILGVLVIGWVSLVLPGRVSWVHYSLPASATSVGNETVVPVPSDEPDGTNWRVETIVGASTGQDLYRLKVNRWLSTVRVNPGEVVVVEGERYTYVGLRRLPDNHSAIVLKKLP